MSYDKCLITKQLIMQQNLQTTFHMINYRYTSSVVISYQVNKTLHKMFN